MIPTFVITLREGVEASLIVGIIAAFLVKEGRQDALRQMWIGVGIAILLCTAVGVGLDLVNEELPQKQQEGLETIVGLIAVATISYMIIWLTRHSRGIKAELEGEAASALATGSAMALVGMAFLAVLREGFETSVFLLLVFVAAGLLASAAHTAHEAGWITSMQSQAIDLSWLVKPGEISGSLLTGMLGLQPRPVTIEVIVYLAYAIPMTIYVLWPQRFRPGNRVKSAPKQPAAAPSPPAE